ncbi:S9 family peptidase [Tenuibacillus multivorans]|uniref:Dipeptidyl aminopeptidase/acylaminoacyl peptidase n=1 Tax=Tenuibacillus multivorans TaxID=237069 RepID=A0A1G9WE35_9BACI|nr:S9 family peptidase [Tenuibacillus multivorans]GEL76414.1 peptidase S9 [Tenuibacillus multivorans]SDM82567.1 Dipeptidyl aminopeptidase/acylaminoacyl peptidase [Tenuibacillus multivorans]
MKFKKPDVEQFFRTYGIQLFAVSPDESQLAFSTNLNGKFNLWAMDIPNTFPYPLTFHDQSTDSLQYDKSGEYLLFSSDHDGDENSQLYAIPPQGGEPKPIRTSEGHRHIMPSLSNDGKKVYYTSNKEDQTFLKAYVYDMENDEEDVFLEGEDAPTFLVKKSPDETSLIYSKMFSNTSQLAYVLYNGEHYRVTPETDHQHTFGGLDFASETEIYFTTSYDSDFEYLAKFDLETKEFSKVKQIEGEALTDVKYDESSNSLYLVGVKGVKDSFYRYDLENGTLEELNPPTSVIAQVEVAKSGNVYLMGVSATAPANIYKYANGKWEQLTNFGVPGVAKEEMVEPEIITYPSFDGKEIEAMYFRAKPENDNGYVILWPHGGPQAAERSTFRALFQFLIYQGYSLFTPNFRGSTGYGLTFTKMVEGDWGYGPRLDNVEGLEWLIKNGYADRDKILLMGGSYGGYMALLLHGRHSEYFKAVVDIFGVSNLFSFVDSVPEHWKPIMKQWLGDPEKDKEKFEEDTPITYLDSMTKPMLVIQGAQDPRVVKAESDQVVEALQKQGTEVDYLVLDDEGHGFSKKENEIKVYKKVLEFFEQYV